jgi:glutathione S-transferase
MAVTLHFVPLACSIAVRIALDEAGIDARFEQASPRSPDFAGISDKHRVPVLVLDDGSVLTEASAILLWIADQAPQAGLAPERGSPDFYRLLSWLSFTASELHKKSIGPLISTTAPDAVKAYAASLAPADLDVVARHLATNDWLVGNRFSVADAYLFAVLNWLQVTPIPADGWPPIQAFRERMLQRPRVRAAVALEYALFKQA